MRLRPTAAVCLLAGLAPCAGEAAAAAAGGTPQQIAWVRRAAANFIAAELRGDGAASCAILAAPLRAAERGRSCRSRWDARLSALRRDRPAWNGLRADARAVAGARVTVHAHLAEVELPAPLLAGHSRFAWSEMCWMLER